MSFLILSSLSLRVSFFSKDTATTEIYTLSLHDALPIFIVAALLPIFTMERVEGRIFAPMAWTDRKSTRLNSSHLGISYAVFCLKKKKPERALVKQRRRTVPNEYGQHTT